MKQLKVVLIGAGGRGRNYTDLMNSEKFKVVGVAEPIKDRREYIRDKHNIPDEMCFNTWEPLLELPKFADVAIISTMDQLHHAPALAAIEKGYDLLLEKPVSNQYSECVEIANAAKEKGTKILVCHVLRYTPFFMAIKKMIDDNKIGKVLSVHHSENVGHLHQSHSFVRGNWGNSQTSSFMLLQKSCHDMDIIQWLVGSPCKKVHSFGSLSYFTRENAPEGSPEYCYEGCPHKDTCHYDATVLYSKDSNEWFAGHALQKADATEEDYINLQRNTQYGKCVFKCDNDVVDHQVVNLEFESGAVASFNMCAFNEGGRFIRIMGTEGEIYGSAKNNTLEYFSFKTGEKTTFDAASNDLTDSIVHGHGGGDEGIVETLYKYLAEGYESDQLSLIDISTKNHLIAFAAEKSRLENKVINIEEFQKEAGLE